MSEPIEPTQGGFATPATGSEPPLPRAFAWAGRELVVKTILRVWRTSKNDRGDDYLKRHWYEVETEDGARAQLYYDREVRRGQSHWWLFTIET